MDYLIAFQKSENPLPRRGRVREGERIQHYFTELQNLPPLGGGN
jgi:hypothetical protein